MIKSRNTRSIPASGAAAVTDRRPTLFPVVPGPDDGDDWDEAVLAARGRDHERALKCFRREAEARFAEGSYGRAAVAFRSAAAQALHGDVGWTLTEQLLRKAAETYVESTYHGELPAAARCEALRTAAICYLQVRDLDAASHCLDMARDEPALHAS